MKEIINVGVLPNDGTGDPLRSAFEKINNNFTQLFSLQAEVPLHSYGSIGDKKGMSAIDNDYFYICVHDYVDDSTTIWKRISLTTEQW